MGKTLQEQLREAMAGAEAKPRGNTEGNQQIGGDAVLSGVKRALKIEDTDNGEVQTDQSNVTDDGAEHDEDGLQGQEGEETAEGERQPLTISDLAEQLGWEPEALYAVKIPLGDGESMTIGEWKDGTKELQAWKTERETQETEIAERDEKLTQEKARLTELLNTATPRELILAEAELLQAQNIYQSINWQELEQSDPGRAALQRMKLTEQIRLSAEKRDGIVSHIQAVQQELATQQMTAAKQTLEKATLELHRLIPTWADVATFTREREALIEYGIKNGIDEAMLRSVTDPKLVHFLYRQWQQDRKRENAKPVEKPPKVLKPQAVVNRQKGAAAKQAKIVEQAKGSRDTRVQQTAVRNILYGR